MIKKFPELISRMTIGYIFIESGLGKLKNLPQVVTYFESLKIPLASFQAPLVSGLELFLGLFILVGFFSRLSSLPLIAIMTVAIITTKSEEITSISSLLGTTEFLYIVILLWITANGSQFISIDSWRNRRQQHISSLPSEAKALKM